MTTVSEHTHLEKNRQDDDNIFIFSDSDYDIGENQNDPVGITNDNFDPIIEGQNLVTMNRFKFTDFRKNECQPLWKTSKS